MASFSVRMFAYLKDRHGERMEVEAEPSVEGVLQALLQNGVQTRACRLSVNLSFPTGNLALQETDKLALIPPVSGG